MADQNGNAAPAPDQVKHFHPLNERETATLAGINQQAVQIKAQLFDLDQQRAKLAAQLEQCQQNFNGAVASMGATHGIEPASITPDFRQLIRGNPPTGR